MPADKKKIAIDCFKKGTEAMSKENWDFAVEMFSTSVAMGLDNVMFRQTLRGCQKKKYKDNGRGAGMSGMKLMKSRGRIKKSRMQQNWQQIERVAEEGLKINPWDSHLNGDLAEACQELGYDEVAVFAYREALAGNPDNVDLNRALALLLEERGEYAVAKKHWEKIKELNPLDGEARSKITQLDARTVMDRGGYTDAQSTRDVKEEQPEIVSAYDLDRPIKKNIPEAVEGPGVSVEADLQREIRKEPANTENYLKLADYYRRNKQLDECAEAFEKALEVSGGDPNIREQLEDVQLLQLRHNLDLAKQAVAKKPDDEKRKKTLNELVREFRLREIEIFSSRVERYPKDSVLKFELARRLMEFEKWSQAIPLLQRAAADLRIQAEVAVALGECFLKDKKTPLARRQFERTLAMEHVNAHDKPDLFKKAHYYLARLCEKAGQRSDAENHYQEILAVDYEYRDVLKRLEKLQQGPATDESQAE